MPVKIRLSRQGKKGYPFYHIVVADSRAPRDGRYIERLGSYNPNTNPATVDFDFDKALDWLQKGALPTDTTRSLLSGKGVLVKKHLLDGVKKGAFTLEVAEEKFAAWMKERELKNQAAKDKISKASETDRKDRLAAEAKVRDARAQAIAKKYAEQSATAATETAEEASEEAPAAE